MDKLRADVDNSIDAIHDFNYDNQLRIFSVMDP